MARKRNSFIPFDPFGKLRISDKLRAFGSLIILISFTLAGCSSIEDRRDRVRGVLDDGAATASGAVSIVERQWHALWALVSGVIKFGQDTAANVQETVQEVEHRVQKVQKGMEKIQEGRELLEEGLQGD